MPLSHEVALYKVLPMNALEYWIMNVRPKTPLPWREGLGEGEINA